jgi:hypothetical protein
MINISLQNKPEMSEINKKKTGLCLQQKPIKEISKNFLFMLLASSR